jgi:hypothetical protein
MRDVSNTVEKVTGKWSNTSRMTATGGFDREGNIKGMNC